MRLRSSLAFVLAPCLLLAGCMDGPTEEPVDSETSRRPHCPAVPPAEQRVASPDDVRCQGQYAFVTMGDGVPWRAPAWEEGDSWFMEIGRAADEMCLQTARETVVGTNESFGVPVYDVRVELMDCAREPLPFDADSVVARTQATLQYIHRNGYVHHDIVPEARDGAEWSFIDNTDRFATVRLEHLPEYGFGNDTLEAWRTEITRVGLNVKYQWWGVDAGNLLREETWTWAGELDGVRHLVDSSRGYGSPMFD